MPKFLITIHLESGGAASITQDAHSPGPLEAAVVQQVNQHDARFRLQFPGAVIDVPRDKVIGWTIDET